MLTIENRDPPMKASVVSHLEYDEYFATNTIGSFDTILVYNLNVSI